MNEIEVRAFLLAIKRALLAIVAACDHWLKNHPQ